MPAVAVFVNAARPAKSTLFPYTTLFRSNNVFRKFSAFHDETGRLNVDGMNIISNDGSNKTACLIMEGRSEERFSRNAETDLVCRLLLEKKKEIRKKVSREEELRVQCTNRPAA